MVVAHERNPSVRDFMHAIRSRHGFQVIYSDRSVFTGLPSLQALRRDQIVGMQIEPWGPMPGSHEVEFCGRPTRFQLGPFAVARVAGAPIVPVFALRTGIRRYEIRVVGRFDPQTPAESVAALATTVRAYERLVREVPAQWLMFEDVWGAPAAGGRAAEETVRAGWGRACVGLNRRRLRGRGVGAAWPAGCPGGEPAVRDAQHGSGGAVGAPMRRRTGRSPPGPVSSGAESKRRRCPRSRA